MGAAGHVPPLFAGLACPMLRRRGVKWKVVFLATGLSLHGAVIAHAAPFASAEIADDAGRADDAALASADGPTLWPPDCTRGIPRDGLLLIEHAQALPDSVQVSLHSTAEGRDMPGQLAPEGETLRFQSDAPLDANTEYEATLRWSDADVEGGERTLTSRFTTGEQTMAALAFEGSAALRMLASAELDDAVLLRVAVPRLHGGLPFHAVAVSAELSGEPSAAPVTGEVAPDAALVLEVPVPLGEESERRCVTLHARDALGEEVWTAPACEQIPAREAPEDAQPEGAQPEDAQPVATGARVLVPQPDRPEASVVARGANAVAQRLDLNARALGESPSGCSLGPSDAPSGIAWLLVALPIARRFRARRA